MVIDDVLPLALLLAAVVFAVMNGANDGSTLVSNAMRVPSISPLVASVIVAVAVGMFPLVVGTQVATTLSHRLVPLGGTQGTVLMLIAVCVTIVLVIFFTRLGLPTSLTLALIGAIIGAGVGAGAEVSWSTVGLVLLLGVCAPLVGGVLGWGITRSMRSLRVGIRSASVIGHTHRVAFAGQSLAYAMNDGQKSIAVVVVALSALGQGLRWWHLPCLGVLFWIGTLLRLRRVSQTIGAGFMRVRPWHAVSAEIATTGAVFGSSLLGAPVSMSQTLASALVGSGASEGAHRVRWRMVLNLGLVWVITLPFAALAAGAASAILTWSTA